MIRLRAVCLAGICGGGVVPSQRTWYQWCGNTITGDVNMGHSVKGHLPGSLLKLFSPVIGKLSRDALSLCAYPVSPQTFFWASSSSTGEPLPAFFHSSSLKFWLFLVLTSLKVVGFFPIFTFHIFREKILELKDGFFKCPGVFK